MNVAVVGAVWLVYLIMAVYGAALPIGSYMRRSYPQVSSQMLNLLILFGAMGWLFILPIAVYSNRQWKRSTP